MPQGEIQTDAIVRRAFIDGKRVYVPFLHESTVSNQDGAPSRVMDMVRLQDIADYEALSLDRWGIPSVDPATAHQRERILGDTGLNHKPLDLLLMPGVAFDMDTENNAIRRLGHGKGFYDFFIHRYLVKAALTGPEANLSLYGLALKEQVLDGSPDSRVPVGPLDQGLHGLIVGDGTVL